MVLHASSVGHERTRTLAACHRPSRWAMKDRASHPTTAPIAALIAGIALGLASPVGRAQSAPTVIDPALAVRTAVGGLSQPIGIAFIGAQDWLVIEKNTGQVKRVVNGVVRSTVLDLA